MSAEVARIGPGAYAVDIDGRREVVHVARVAGRLQACCRGEVFTEESAHGATAASASSRMATALPIAAPMPATVRRILTSPGATVTKGEALIVLEAMKMELALRASSDGIIAAIHCREGELVQPETVLIELA